MVVDEALINLLIYVLTSSSFNGLIKLFKNNVTITNATVLGDLTEAAFPGYNNISTVSVGFPTPTINGSDQAETDGPTMTWTCTSTPMPSETIYGLFVTFVDPLGSTRLLFAANFETPIDILGSGDTVNKKLNWFTQNLVP